MSRGRYDEECVAVHLATEAETVILIVIGGKDGMGFSVTSTDPKISAQIPGILRQMADTVELKEGGN